MYDRKVKIAFSLLSMLTLVLASCAPAAAPTPKPSAPAAPTAAPAAKPAAPTVAPAAKPAAPAATPKPAAEQPRYGGTIAISTVGDPLSFDMHQEASYLVQNVIHCAYNGVTQFDPDNPEEVIGDLGKSWELSKDGLTYTFHLHEGVKFHDGTPLTSEDVKVSFDRQTDPPKGIRAQRRADLTAIDKIETPDKNTVKFILKYPAGAFLDVISSGLQLIYSKAFVEKKGHMKNDVMGTGPFKFKSYASGTSLEYVKNPDYFVKERPYLDGLTFYIIKDAGTRLAAFRTGQIKLTGPGNSGLTPADAEIVKKSMPQAITMSYPSYSHGNFILNVREKPWDDIRMRKAVHLAIDRQKAVDILAQGYGEVGSHMPGKWGIPQEELLKMPGFRQPKDADIAEAKKLVAEAGYASGITLKTLVRAEKQFEEIAVYVQDQVGKIGIKLELDIKEAAVRTDLLNKGAFNNHPLQSSLSYPDPENVTRYWAAPLGENWGMNWQRVEDKKIWELFEKQSRAIDPAERKKIVRELDMAMIDSAARPIIYWKKDQLGYWPEVKGRGKLSGNYSFQKYQDLWLAK
ncbi:MAG: ABC transporter substrate-binding protein [Chloroflexota bacterium]